MGNILFTQAIANPVDVMHSICYITAGGVCERFPDTKFLFLEANGGWLVPWLERLDHHSKKFEWDVPWLKMLPSEYFRRQCWISFDPDESMLAFTANSPLCGADRIVWASDYPHPDAKFPGVTEELAEALEPLDVRAAERDHERERARVVRHHVSTPAPRQPVLQGLRVVDLSWGIAGPLTTMLLGDYGADVVKVEPPGGDPFRTDARLHGVEPEQEERGPRPARRRRPRGVPPAHGRRRRRRRELLAGHHRAARCRLRHGAEATTRRRVLLDHRLRAERCRAGPSRLRRLGAGAVGTSRTSSPDSGRDRCSCTCRCPASVLHSSRRSASTRRCFTRDRTGRGQWVETSLVQGALAYLTQIWKRAENAHAHAHGSLALQGLSADACFEAGDGKWFHPMPQGLGARDPSRRRRPRVAVDARPVDDGRLRSASRLLRRRPRRVPRSATATSGSSCSRRTTCRASRSAPPRPALDHQQVVHNGASVVGRPFPVSARSSSSATRTARAPRRPVPTPPPAAGEHTSRRTRRRPRTPPKGSIRAVAVRSRIRSMGSVCSTSAPRSPGRSVRWC